MYLPEHFRVEDRGRLFDVIRRHPLGLLILSGQRGLTADPVPFLVDESANVLRCHVARANPAWQAIEAGAQALVAFQGADHYVSPGWYPSKAEHHRVVPTWNYVSVQVSGAARTFHGPQRLLELVGALTTRNEAGRSEPWAVSDAPADFVEAQLRAIVGVEISIDRLEGKFKASQNRSAADRASVAAHLEAQGDALSLEASAAIRAGKD